MDIADNLREVKARVARAALACGRDPHEITVLAVSKTFDHTAVRAAALLGQKDFGENYVQEALGKQIAVADPELIWHFIGPIQSNKTRGIAENFAWVHSLDRFKIAERLSAQRSCTAPPLNICIEVNVSGEASKSGVSPEALTSFVDEVAVLPQLHLRGLMAIPAPTTGLAQQRAAFRQVRELFDRLNQRGHQLDTLSMGMSADLEAAIAEGSTLVRIGTAVFGNRV